MTTPNIIPWTTRPDLVSVSSSNQLGGRSSVVKDIVKNEFFHFDALDFFVLEQLRHPLTLSQLAQRIHTNFNERYAPAELIETIQRLASDNLLSARGLGDGQRLFRQYQRQQSGVLLKTMAGMLSFRVPGIYPGWILKSLQPVGWLLFNAFSLVLFLIVALGTLLYAGLSWDTLATKLPDWWQMLSPDHLLLMLFGFIAAKILHEIGHALACQHTGHECTEMGVMLLVFTPCLYCDVSDMWSEPSRWKRILVSLAGVYVELAIAIVCFWGWYFTVDGRLHQFCFGMMLVTSLNTLFINGNPLMRYDGYYAMSDWVRIPNLATRSRGHLISQIQEFFTQQEPEPGRTPKAWFLSVYGVASFVYRWFILFAIGWGIWAFFDRMQLPVVGRAVVAIVLFSSIIPIIMSIYKSIQHVLNFGLRIGNTVIVAAVMALLLWSAVKIEFSARIWGTATMQLAESTQLFMPVDGFFQALVSDRELIESNQIVAKIENDDLTLERIALSGQLQEVQHRLKSLNVMADSQAFANEVEFLKKRQLSLESNLQDLELREKSLEIHSPVGGRLVGLKRPPTPIDNERLALIEGSVFDRCNQGCFLQRGEVLGWVGAPDRLTGYLEIDEKDIELVQLGQPVRLFSPNATYQIEGIVTKISLEGNPAERHDAAVQRQPNQPETASIYIVEFEMLANENIRVGSIQKAVILGQPTTLAQSLRRWWRTTVWY